MLGFRRRFGKSQSSLRGYEEGMEEKENGEKVDGEYVHDIVETELRTKLCGWRLFKSHWDGERAI